MEDEMEDDMIDKDEKIDFFQLFFAYPLALGGGILIYYAPVRPQRRTSILENRKLEIKENCNVYRDARRRNLAKRIRAHDGCLGIGRR